MTPLPLLLKRNLTYLNCPKSLASSRISKDTGLSLSATNPPALPRPGGGSPPRHLGSRWPGRLHASAKWARLPRGDPSPAPHLSDPSSLRTQLPAGAAVAAPPDWPSWGTVPRALSPCEGDQGASHFRLDTLRGRSGLGVASPGGFVCPPLAGRDRAPMGPLRARPPAFLQQPRSVNFSLTFQNPFKNFLMVRKYR